MSSPGSQSSSGSSDDASVVGGPAVWSWLVKKTEIDDLNETAPLAAGLKRKVNKVKRVPKGQGGQGEWEFVEYHPEWTDPEFNPEYEIWHDTNEMRKRRKRDITQIMRPALLLQDQLKNPTIHALRWGMHPDGAAGRSFVTPTVAIGAKVNVPGEGLKSANDFLRATIVDNEHPQGMSLREYFSTNADARENLSEDEKTQAWLKLYDVISNNQDYQRFLFDGYTTDDFVEQGVYDPANLMVCDSNLQGPLHPLLFRERWLKTDHLGGNEASPRNLFNINGHRGEYTAWNDMIWAALQPALQMATRILNSNHPYWVALFNLYNRGPIEHGRDSRNNVQQGHIPIRDNLKLNMNLNDMWDESKRLHALDYPSIDVTSKVLMDRLRWEFGSVYRNTGEEKQMNNPNYGATTYDRQYPGKSPITIKIGAELIFPLLVQSYSLAEKASCSFIVAATMLHELAHAAHFAHHVQFEHRREWEDLDPSYRNFDPEVYARLQQLFHRLIDPRGRCDESFFENEVQAEMGFAFENRLFGGLVETVPKRYFRDLQWQSVMAVKAQWPRAAYDPHPLALQGSSEFLQYPAAHAMDLDEALPVELGARFFNNEFWSCNAVKYGWQAFKLTPDVPLKARTGHSFPHGGDKDWLYGSAAVARWIQIADGCLHSAGHHVIAAYLSALSWEDLEGVGVKRVWTYEQQTWHETDLQLEALVKVVQAAGPAISQKLQILRSAQPELVRQYEQARQQWQALQASGQVVGQIEPTIHDFIDDHIREIYQHFCAFIQSVGEIHRCLTTEIIYLQNLIYDYLMDDVAGRTDIWHSSGNHLSIRMTVVHQRLTTGTIGLLDAIEPYVVDLLQFNNQWPPEIMEDIHKYRRLLQMDHNHITHTLEFLKPEYMNADITLPEFAGVLPSRKKSWILSLRNMAIREMALIEEPVLMQVIERWYDIIHRQADFAHDTGEFESQELKNDVEEAVQRLRAGLKSHGISLDKTIDNANSLPSKVGTVFDVSRIPENTGQNKEPDPQPPAPPQQPPAQKPPAAEFLQTPDPSHWSQQTRVPFPTQGAFAQFANQQAGFGTGAPNPGLFSSGSQTWGTSRPLGGTSATAFAPFPHPYATRETTTEDIELERMLQLFSGGMHGGQTLQAQLQHGVAPAFQTYRETPTTTRTPLPSNKLPDPVENSS